MRRRLGSFLVSERVLQRGNTVKGNVYPWKDNIMKHQWKHLWKDSEKIPEKDHENAKIRGLAQQLLEESSVCIRLWHLEDFLDQKTKPLEQVPIL